MGMTRRDALKGIGAAVGAAAIACGGNADLGPDPLPDGATPGPDGATPGPDGATPGPDGATPGVDGGVDARPIIDGGEPPTACSAPTDMTPAQLLAGIDTFVVLCMENRSFDHYLGSLRLVEGRTDIDGLRGTESNLSAEGAPIGVHRLDNYTPADPPHSWDQVHRQWNDGACDGFVREHEGPHQADVMGYHTRDQLPITYALADQSAICQRWFCSVLGATWPNRFYLHAGSSRGQRGNLPVYGMPTIFDRLGDANLRHTNYFHDVAWALGGYLKTQGLAPVERFFEDAAAGTLPNYTLIDPHFFGPSANDDHPSTDIRMGQALIASVVRAMGASPQWNRCMIVITYDEHGGFYDHVPPPECDDDQGLFRRLGFRVPSLVIGPTVRRGCAIDTVYDHSSVISTLTARFGLEPLSPRSTAAAPLSACIDPALIARPQPMPELPAVQISMDRLRKRVGSPDAHHELRAQLDKHNFPPHLDRRGESDAITRRLLKWGERLGAVEIVD
jgi:phospholipase C